MQKFAHKIYIEKKRKKRKKRCWKKLNSWIFDLNKLWLTYTQGASWDLVPKFASLWKKREKNLKTRFLSHSSQPSLYFIKEETMNEWMNEWYPWRFGYQVFNHGFAINLQSSQNCTKKKIKKKLTSTIYLFVCFILVVFLLTKMGDNNWVMSAIKTNNNQVFFWGCHWVVECH
jgi:hypothetical protein